MEEHEASSGYCLNEVETCLLPQGPVCIKPAPKCSLKQVTYESVMGALTGVAWNALGTLVIFWFTW